MPYLAVPFRLRLNILWVLCGLQTVHYGLVSIPLWGEETDDYLATHTRFALPKQRSSILKASLLNRSIGPSGQYARDKHEE